MEFSSKPSKSASRCRNNSRRMDWDLFSTVIAQYAADVATTPDSVGGALDPTQLQEGQSVFDNEGNEQIIVGNPDDTAGKVLMPADQVETGQPAGAYNVEDAELASQYQLQSPVASADGCTYFPGRNFYIDANGCNRSLGHTIEEFYEGWKQADLVMDLNPASLGGVSSLDTAVDNNNEEDGLRIGQPGYVEIIDSIKAMKDIGYDTVDIVLNIGELYDREIGERVLAEARRKGII